MKSAADQAGSKVDGAVDSVKGLAAEAADTARATGKQPPLLYCSGQNSVPMG